MTFVLIVAFLYTLYEKGKAQSSLIGPVLILILILIHVLWKEKEIEPASSE